MKIIAEEWEMPCDLCDTEDGTVKWVGPADDRGMFLCARCREMDPEHQFRFAVMRARNG